MENNNKHKYIQYKNTIIRNESLTGLGGGLDEYIEGMAIDFYEDIPGHENIKIYENTGLLIPYDETSKTKELTHEEVMEILKNKIQSFIDKEYE
jgi:hypothetical protein